MKTPKVTLMTLALTVALLAGPATAQDEESIDIPRPVDRLLTPKGKQDLRMFLDGLVQQLGELDRLWNESLDEPDPENIEARWAEIARLHVLGQTDVVTALKNGGVRGPSRTVDTVPAPILEFLGKVYVAMELVQKKGYYAVGDQHYLRHYCTEGRNDLPRIEAAIRTRRENIAMIDNAYGACHSILTSARRPSDIESYVEGPLQAIFNRIDRAVNAEPTGQQVQDWLTEKEPETLFGDPTRHVTDWEFDTRLMAVVEKRRRAWKTALEESFEAWEEVFEDLEEAIQPFIGDQLLEETEHMTDWTFATMESRFDEMTARLNARADALGE